MYVAPGEHNPAGFELLSYGDDGKFGGEKEAADVTSWQ